MLSPKANESYQAQIRIKKIVNKQTSYPTLALVSLSSDTNGDWFEIGAEYQVEEGDVQVYFQIYDYIDEYIMDHFYLGSAAQYLACRFQQKDIGIRESSFIMFSYIIIIVK